MTRWGRDIKVGARVVSRVGTGQPLLTGTVVEVNGPVAKVNGSWRQMNGIKRAGIRTRSVANLRVEP